MPPTKGKRQKAKLRLPVTLDEGKYGELPGRCRAGPVRAWMIRRAESEFVARHRSGIEADLPLRRPESGSERNKKAGGSRGQ